MEYGALSVCVCPLSQRRQIHANIDFVKPQTPIGERRQEFVRDSGPGILLVIPPARPPRRRRERLGAREKG